MPKLKTAILWAAVLRGHVLESWTIQGKDRVSIKLRPADQIITLPNAKAYRGHSVTLRSGIELYWELMHGNDFRGGGIMKARDVMVRMLLLSAPVPLACRR